MYANNEKQQNMFFGKTREKCEGNKCTNKQKKLISRLEDDKQSI